MIATILPSCVAAVDTRRDPTGVALFPEETILVERARQVRRLEFVAGRWCARRALAQLGHPPVAIGHGPSGEPLWPEGLTGSITHCSGYRAAAIGRSWQIAAIGIDAEPHSPLKEDLLDTIAVGVERDHLRELARQAPAVRWERLLFSAKESAQKAWFAFDRTRRTFEDARIAIDPAHGTFTAQLMVEGPVLGGRRLAAFDGRWLVRGGFVLTAIALPALANDAAR